MSAPILRRGDRIQLAFPISPTLYGRELQAKLDEDAAAFTRSFANQGVTLVAWTANSSLSHPVIVAVFRDQLEAE